MCSVDSPSKSSGTPCCLTAVSQDSQTRASLRDGADVAEPVLRLSGGVRPADRRATGEALLAPCDPDAPTRGRPPRRLPAELSSPHRARACAQHSPRPLGSQVLPPEAPPAPRLSRPPGGCWDRLAPGRSPIRESMLAPPAGSSWLPAAPSPSEGSRGRRPRQRGPSRCHLPA